MFSASIFFTNTGCEIFRESLIVCMCLEANDDFVIEIVNQGSTWWLTSACSSKLWGLDCSARGCRLNPTPWIANATNDAHCLPIFTVGHQNKKHNSKIRIQTYFKFRFVSSCALVWINYKASITESWGLINQNSSAVIIYRLGWMNRDYILLSVALDRLVVVRPKKALRNQSPCCFRGLRHLIPSVHVVHSPSSLYM